jgi:uncharacterized membrane protein YebE (DUF533 family)
MKTSDLLLLAVGAGLGYLAFKKYQQNKAKKDNTQPQVTTQQTCEEKWTEKAKTMKLSSDALATAKANFMLSCSPVLTATV